jgi:molybdopterin-guanine dinucleotide biosynthesis protein MobB
LAELVAAMDLARLDLVLVEGFRRTTIPRLEIHRASRGNELQCSADDSVIALASDARPLPVAHLPVFALDDVPAIAAFVAEHVARTARLQRDGASA